MSLRPSTRVDARRDKYRATMDAEEGRRKREDQLLVLRKERKEDTLLKKRRESSLAMQASFLAGADGRPPVKVWQCSATALPAGLSAPPTLSRAQLESLQAMVQGVASEDPAVQLEATAQFRKLLSIG